MTLKVKTSFDWETNEASGISDPELSLVENSSTWVIGHPVTPLTKPVKVKSKSPEGGGERLALEVKMLANSRPNDNLPHTMLIINSWFQLNILGVG